MSATTLTDQPSLQTTFCPNCGYSLAGLESAGVCPECGRSYDQIELVLYGWARGAHETIANAKRSRLVWVWLCSECCFLCQAPLLLSNRWFLIVGTSLLAASTMYLIFRRGNTEHPGLIQIRLNYSGCVQFDDLAGSSLIRDAFRAHGWMLFAAAAVYLPIAFRLGQITRINFAFWMLVVIVGAPFTWRWCRRFRRAFEQLREGSIADLNIALHKPKLWTKIKRFSFDPTPSGTYRLVIHSFDGFSGQTPVDADIQCTPVQVAGIKTFIAKQIANASGERAESEMATKTATNRL